MEDIGVSALARVHDVFTRAGLDLTEQSESSLKLSSPTAHYICDFANPDVFQIKGVWRRTVALEDRGSLVHFAARCNRERVVPKAYVLPAAAGRAVTLGAEVNAVTTHGLSRDQFYGFVDSAVVAIATFFADADKDLPLAPVSMGVVRN